MRKAGLLLSCTSPAAPCCLALALPCPSTAFSGHCPHTQMREWTWCHSPLWSGLSKMTYGTGEKAWPSSEACHGPDGWPNLGSLLGIGSEPPGRTRARRAQAQLLKADTLACLLLLGLRLPYNSPSICYCITYESMRGRTRLASRHLL